MKVFQTNVLADLKSTSLKWLCVPCVFLFVFLLFQARTTAYQNQSINEIKDIKKNLEKKKKKDHASVNKTKIWAKAPGQLLVSLKVISRTAEFVF